MRAVFKGYKKFGSYKFTPGKIYELEACSRYNCHEVRDDDLALCILGSDDIYDFQVLIPDILIQEKKQFKYYINGEAFSKVKFDDTLSCVNDFKSYGIDTSSIKFEVKFE